MTNDEGRRVVPFKFEHLKVWQPALEYVDLVYEMAGQLPKSEEYNLKSQVKRAATSVALNIAEGSTGQTDAEQARFLGLAIRSLLATVACQHLISRRKLLKDITPLREAYRRAETLAAKLHTMRRVIAPQHPWLREEEAGYAADNGSGDKSDERRWTKTVLVRLSSTVLRLPSRRKDEPHAHTKPNPSNDR